MVTEPSLVKNLKDNYKIIGNAKILRLNHTQWANMKMQSTPIIATPLTQVFVATQSV